MRNLMPHDYQKYAIDFIEKKEVAALFLDMGLGKTSITLTAIKNLLFDSFKAHKVLVIAPLRVAKNTWKSEIEKWEHLKDLKYSVIVGSKKERMTALDEKADIYIINRENVDWLVENYEFDFDMVVIDELSSFKNSSSKRFKALMMVRPKAKRLVGLTGTPSTNGLMDLFAEFKVLDMGKRLGRFITKFREEYFVPDKRNGEVIFSYKPKHGAEEKIYEKISDITMSMKAVDHLAMPELIVNTYEVEMEKTQKFLYQKLCQELFLGEEVTISNAATLSNKLMQMVSGMIYTDDKESLPIHDKKLEALEDIIESLNGKPMLLAYWFKHDLYRIENKLKDMKVNFRRIDDDESIERWNKGEITVGLIHPQSVGHGLNLQKGGSHMVWYTPIWSLELYQQTRARLYRQGQESSSVVITHIITKDTIDGYIMDCLERKDMDQKRLIDAVKANIGD